MVALGSQVVPEMADLIGEARQDRLGDARRQSGESRRRREAVPRVDPVLDTAPRDITIVAVDRDLPDPRDDEAFPGAKERGVSRLGEGMGEIEAVVELRPADPPFLVRGKLGTEPIRLDTEIEGDPCLGKASRADGLRPAAIPVGVLDHAEDRSWRRLGMDDHRTFPLSNAGENRATSCLASASPSKRARTVAWPSRARRAARAGSRWRRFRAAASASASLQGTSRPLTP